jgi:ADP-L-glycero-D-manno-heptose 6-epimerase
MLVPQPLTVFTTAYYHYALQAFQVISIDDLLKVTLSCVDHSERSGIFNLGTGEAQTFNEVAVATVNAVRASRGEERLELEQMRSQALIEYTPFPSGLKEKYQSYTQADIAQLRRAGYSAPFLNVEQGAGRYVKWLLEN